ncbi:MAG: DUF5985 family protein [Bdellovibrionota bacterium]
MAQIVYILCAATSILCALLLIRGYRHTRSRFLLWSACGFGGLAVNNVILYFDRIVYPDADFSVWPVAPALVGMIIMIYGLIRDTTV